MSSNRTEAEYRRKHIAMWSWIVQQLEAGSRADISSLKRHYLAEKEEEYIHSACYACHMMCKWCSGCPLNEACTLLIDAEALECNSEGLLEAAIALRDSWPEPEPEQQQKAVTETATYWGNR